MDRANSVKTLIPLFSLPSVWSDYMPHFGMKTAAPRKLPNHDPNIYAFTHSNVGKGISELIRNSPYVIAPKSLGVLTNYAGCTIIDDFQTTLFKKLSP